MLSVSFALAFGLSLVASWRWARHFCGGDRVWAISGALILWYGLQTSAVLIAGVGGGLRPLFVHLVLIGLSLILLRLGRNVPTPPGRYSLAVPTRGWAIGAAIMAYYLIKQISAALPRLNHAPYDGDSLLYHLPAAVSWLQSGDLLATNAPYWFYPCSSQLICHGLLTSGAGDGLANWQNLPAFLIFLLAVARLAEAFGAPRNWSLTAAAVFGVAARVIRRQAFTQENDLFLAACLLAALAWLLSPPHERRRISWVIPGVAFGLALGTKYNALLYGLVIVGGTALVCSAGTRRLERKEWHLIISTALLVGAYSYLRNWALTGSPFYPLGFHLGPCEVFPDSRSEFAMFSDLDSTRIMTYVGDVETWRLLFRACRKFLGWWPLLGGLAAPMLLVRLPRRERLGIAGILVGFFLVLCVTPLAAENVPGTLNQLRHGYSPARYALPLAGLLIAVLAAEVGRIRQPARISRWLGANVVRPESLGWIRLTALARRLGAIVSGDRRSAAGCVAVALTIVGFMHLPSSRAAHRESRIENYTTIGSDRSASSFFSWYDREIHGRRVWTDRPRTYPFIGPDLNNRVDYVTDLQPLLTRDRSVETLPELLVLTARWNEQGGEALWQFSEQDSMLQAQPERFEEAFADSLFRAYWVRSAEFVSP